MKFAGEAWSILCADSTLRTLPTCFRLLNDYDECVRERYPDARLRQNGLRCAHVELFHKMVSRARSTTIDVNLLHIASDHGGFTPIQQKVQAYRLDIFAS